jgi:hypothetical protein
MKLLCVAVLAIGCGKTDIPATSGSAGSGSAGSGSAGSGSATGSAAGSAAPVAHGATLPDNARCTGRWIATVNYDSSKTCDAATLAPYLDVDAVVAAGPTGWTATVTKPAGMTVKWVSATWSSGDHPSCHTKINLVKGNIELTVEVSRGVFGDKPQVSPSIYRHSDDHCMGNGNSSGATFTTDGVTTLPPPPPDQVAVAGTYELELAWPKKYKCKVIKPPTSEKLTLAIDRREGDTLVATGLEGPFSVSEVRLNEPGEVYLRTSHTSDVKDTQVISEVVDILHVKGNEITGDATFRGADPGDEPPPCKDAKATVKGTRTP